MYDASKHIHLLFNEDVAFLRFADDVRAEPHELIETIRLHTLNIHRCMSVLVSTGFVKTGEVQICGFTQWVYVRDKRNGDIADLLAIPYAEPAEPPKGDKPAGGSTDNSPGAGGSTDNSPGAGG